TSGRGGGGNRWSIRCFKCNGLGHIARYCRAADEDQQRDGERELATSAEEERLIYVDANVDKSERVVRRLRGVESHDGVKSRLQSLLRVHETEMR
ncbi:MAG: hypothetical protein GY737_18955, partial [Desulfobacteraceae bacterium]|nr:hypothetical protein [Desulfobacteraceae bacterium]